MSNIEFYCRIALEYRLSINTLTQLFPVTETEINSYLESLLDRDLYNAYKFLFNSDSEYEDKRTINRVKMLLKQYIRMQAQNLPEEEQERNMKFLLYKTDLDIEEMIKSKDYRGKYHLISKYRLKYALSTEEIASALGIERRFVCLAEYKMKDESLKERLENAEVFATNNIRRHR